MRLVGVVDAGVGDEDIEAPEPADGLLDDLVQVAQVRHVTVDEHAVAAGCLDFPNGRIAVLVRRSANDNFGTFPHEFECYP